MAPLKGKVTEFVGAALRKANGEIYLFLREYVHGEVTGGCEMRQAQRGLPEAPKHHRRIQGDGVEAIGGQANVIAVVGSRDDGDACREGTKSASEFLQMDG
jgi:hypothetical protein